MEEIALSDDDMTKLTKRTTIQRSTRLPIAFFVLGAQCPCLGRPTISEIDAEELEQLCCDWCSGTSSIS